MLTKRNLRRFYDEPEDSFGVRTCRAIYYRVQIAANGDVSCCRDFPDIVHGNVTGRSLREILNCESFGRFRRSVIREPL